MCLSSIVSALKVGNTSEIRQLTLKALENGYSAQQVLDEALIPGMDQVAEMFKDSELFIPEVLKVSRAMHGAIRILQQDILKGDNNLKEPTKVVIGTVAGDLHDIGKNLVTIFMKAKGYNVINLGIDVPTSEFIWAVRKHKPQVLAISALLTTTMPAMLDTINQLKKEGIRDTVKVLIGGVPVTKEYAEKIEADGYAYDAKTAVDWMSKHFPVFK